MSNNISQDIYEQVDALADAIFNRQMELQPELLERYTPAEKEQFRGHMIESLKYLAQSIDLESTVLFSDYINWLKIVLESREIPVRDLRINLHCMQQLLSQRYGREEADILAEYLDAARAELEKTMPSFYATGLRGEYSGLARAYLKALLEMDRDEALGYIHAAVENGIDLRDLYQHVFTPVLQEIGRMWQFNQIEPGCEAFASGVTAAAMAELAPRIDSSSTNHLTMLAVGVGAEQHDLALQMLADIFRLAGWNTINLGTGCCVETILEQIASRQVDLLAISVTMGTNLTAVEDVIAAVHKSDTPAVKIIVGGYPFNLVPNLWRQIGADACAPDADAAVHQAEEIIIRGEV